MQEDCRVLYVWSDFVRVESAFVHQIVLTLLLTALSENDFSYTHTHVLLNL